ncbi:MAG: LysR substrate-binding domain-containing protein [Advenella sp.]|uniref:LysR substrate-binding domain-containing protein n=1 Tax=Advenella sp. TaxID=1872388 RepID=UPI003F9BEBD1
MYDKTKPLPSLNGLRIFESASRHLNFRLAAEELGVTQSAVAQQIRKLEAELGIKLFDRLSRSLQLTSEGRTYIAGISRAFDIITEATLQIKPEPRRITLSVTPTFASKWLIPRLPDFLSRNPSLDLQIVATERISNFHLDKVDLAIRYGRPPFGSGLHTELLYQQDIIAVCSPSLLSKMGGRPKNADDLKQFLLLGDTHNFWPEFIQSVIGPASVPSNIGIKFNQTAHAIEAAIAGQGIALTNSFFVEQDIKEGRLTRLYEGSLRGRSDFYIVAPRHRWDGPTRVVGEWLLSFKNGDIQHFE